VKHVTVSLQGLSLYIGALPPPLLFLLSPLIIRPCVLWREGRNGRRHSTQMESKSEREESAATEEKRRKAADQTAASSTSVSRRRRGRGTGRTGGLRARKAGCQSPGGGVGEEPSGGGGEESSPPPPPPPPARTSGRVLRDRSTRSLPAWLKDTSNKSEEDEDEDDEEEEDAGASRRRSRVPCCRRKKPAEEPTSARESVFTPAKVV